MERILIIKLSALGDVVQAEGAIHDIRLHHPDAEITVMTTPPYKRLLERCPWVDQVFLDPRDSRLRLDRMYVLGQRLRGFSFDKVYDLQQVGRTDFYYRWFFRGTPWLGSAGGCKYHCLRSSDQCAPDHFRISLMQAGIATPHTLRSNVEWMADDVEPILKCYELSDNYMVLIPGCSAEHPEKRWSGYGELAQKLLESGWRVVTVPGPDEMDLCEAIPGDTLTDNGVYLDYFQLAGILRKAAFVVGNDTGPTHIAANLRIPGLVLFGAHTPPRTTGIQHSLFSWLEVEDLQTLSLSAVVASIPHFSQ